MQNETPTLVSQAMRHHGDGRLAEAEHCYRAALATEGHNADALHGLGLLEWQTGRLDDARQSLQKACAGAPEVWRYTRTLGRFFATTRSPREALSAFARAKELAPGSAESWFDYANALHAEGRHKESIPAYRRAVELDPGNVEALNNLGAALDAVGDHDGAVQVLHKALARNPAFVPLHNNLGNAMLNRGTIDNAIAAFQSGLSLAADSADLWFNLGNAYAAREPGVAASDAYLRALALEPNHAKARLNLGNVLRQRGDLSTALSHYRRAIESQPDFYDAHNNAGVTLHLMGRLDEAATLLQQAIALAPGLAVAHSHLGNVLKDSGLIEEALACHRQAVTLAPRSAEAHGNLLYTLHFDGSASARDIFDEARRFGERHGAVQRIAAARKLPRNGDRIRIGYVSPDFRQHCQSLFTLPLLSNHDRERFEIYCYAHLARPDEVSQRLAGHTDAWRPTYGASDAQVAQMIAADGIDILVDLTMHMANGRPMLFAGKPAPVQLAWLAYPGTTGMPAIDYRLTDPWLDPVEQGNGLYTEQSLRLPHTFWCYDPLTRAIEPNVLPARDAGYVTFGCMNNFCKVSDDTLDLWGRVLARLPSSRLLLLSPAGQHRERVLVRLGKHGVDAARIEFTEPRPRLDYLRNYHRIDICLDTIPYNGHTTSLDAFWMGVPVVTLVGDTVVGRAGWSQLNNLGMPELAAFDAQAFSGIACGLAGDLPRLTQMRQTLRSRMEASPLMDGPRFARAMEGIYEQLLNAAAR